MPETTPKWNKEKMATNDIDCHSVVLDSLNFYLSQVFRVFRAGRYRRLFR